jgi:ElaA protein
MHPEPHPELRVASFRDLDVTTLYALLKLRVDVFVAEQQCAYPELDGRDTEPGTRHLWVTRDGEPLGYLRILSEDGVERIGRVVVAKAERGAGHAGRLMARALEVIGNRPSVLGAQTQAAAFYRRYGYELSGPEYLDDGIPHVPMRREAPQDV